MEMTDPEYQDQHAWWQMDHDKVMAEMRMEQEMIEKYPHRIKSPMNDSNNTWYILWNWCGEHFECETYGYSANCFYFKREEDAVFFALKWTGHE